MRRHPLIVDSVFQHSSIRDKQFNTGLQVNDASVPSCVAQRQYYPKTDVSGGCQGNILLIFQRWQRKANVKNGRGKVKKLIKFEDNKRKKKRTGIIRKLSACFGVKRPSSFELLWLGRKVKFELFWTRFPLSLSQNGRVQESHRPPGFVTSTEQGARYSRSIIPRN